MSNVKALSKYSSESSIKKSLSLPKIRQLN